MAKQVEKQYWFKTRKFGWGWGMPNTWKGWIAYGAFVAIWLNSMALLILPYETPPIANWLLFIAILLLDIAGLFYISVKFGGPPTKLSFSLSKRKAKRKTKGSDGSAQPKSD